MKKVFFLMIFSQLTQVLASNLSSNNLYAPHLSDIVVIHDITETSFFNGFYYQLLGEHFRLNPSPTCSTVVVQQIDHNSDVVCISLDKQQITKVGQLDRIIERKGYNKIYSIKWTNKARIDENEIINSQGNTEFIYSISINTFEN